MKVVRSVTYAPDLFYVKGKAQTQKSLGFMERVTRLELATSTLARWRSTG